jgi:hypothetical protein
MPTLFDLMKISPAHHSTGVSILRKDATPLVLLSQPYDGIYLSSVQYPYKLVRRLKGNFEALYDLEKDPLERFDIRLNPTLQPLRKQLSGNLSRLMVNQALIEANRIWPDSMQVIPTLEH